MFGEVSSNANVSNLIGGAVTWSYHLAYIVVFKLSLIITENIYSVDGVSVIMLNF